MTKDVRLSLRVAQSGAAAIQKIVEEVPGSDQSKVLREIFTVAVTTPSIRKVVVTRLKQREGIE